MFNLVPFARRILIGAFRKDGFQPGGFFHGYIANIACAIYDSTEVFGVKKVEMVDCNVVAATIMLRLFPELADALKEERRQLSVEVTQPMGSGETVILP